MFRNIFSHCYNDVDMDFFNMTDFTAFIQSYIDFSCDDDFPEGYHSVRLRIDYDI